MRECVNLQRACVCAGLFFVERANGFEEGGLDVHIRVIREGNECDGIYCVTYVKEKEKMPAVAATPISGGGLSLPGRQRWRSGGRSSGGRRITRHRIPRRKRIYRNEVTHGIVGRSRIIAALPAIPTDFSVAVWRSVNRRIRNREHLKRRPMQKRDLEQGSFYSLPLQID